MMQKPDLAALAAAGVSVWLEDPVSKNASIFHRALSRGHICDAQIRELGNRGAGLDAAIRTVITDDIRQACEELDAAAGTRQRCRAGEFRWDGR